MSDELVKLGWEIRGDDVAEAHTPFGSYRVEKTQYFGWHWSYCFDEYCDRDRLSCEDMGEGMSLAEGHWRRCVQPITKPLTDRIKELEANLAKAVEAQAAWKHYDENDEVDHVSLMLNYADAIEKTRTTLAELTGGKDE